MKEAKKKSEQERKAKKKRKKQRKKENKDEKKYGYLELHLQAIYLNATSNSRKWPFSLYLMDSGGMF